MESTPQPSPNPYSTKSNNYNRPPNHTYATKSTNNQPNPYNISLNTKPNNNPYGTLINIKNTNKSTTEVKDFTFPDKTTLLNLVNNKLYESPQHSSPFGEGTFSKVYLLSFDEKRKKHHYILKIVNTKLSNEFSPPPASSEIDILEYLNNTYPELNNYHNKLLGYILYNDKNRAVLLLSFVPGMTLEDWLKKKRSESELTDMFNSILTSIGKLHTSNIIHRDIKPDNIWIPHNNQLPPRFMDFSHSSKDGEVFISKNGRKHQATRKNNINALQRLRLNHKLKGGKTRRR